MVNVDKIRKVGISLAVFYGFFSLATHITFIVLASIPIHHYPTTYLMTLAALPFIFYPFWWVGIAAAAGVLSTMTYYKIALEYKDEVDS